MNEIEKLTWSAIEYEERERGNDWFWALGVIVLASSVTSIIYANYFFAMLLVISGILLAGFAIKKPDMIHYEMDEIGLRVRNHFYPYEKIKSFYVQTDQGKTSVSLRPMLFIKLNKSLLPIMGIPIETELANKIRNYMLAGNVTEEFMKEHPSEKIMEFLGF